MRPCPTSPRSWLSPLLCCAALALGHAAKPSHAAAQCGTTLDCGGPPSITITPSSGSWSTQAQSMALQVEVDFCQDGTAPFTSGNEGITFDGVQQSFTDGAVANRCYASTGTVTLTPGTHTLSAQLVTSGGTGSSSVTYVYSVAPPPAQYGVHVQANSVSATGPIGYPAVETFEVQNTGSRATTFYLQSDCTGVVYSCSISQASIDLPASATTTVGVAYFLNTPQGGTGALTLKAILAADATVRDSATTSLRADTVLQRGKVGMRANMRRLDRGVCAVLAAGPAAAFECGDLRLVHGLPGVRLQNRGLAPTLIYSSAHASPCPVIPAFVAPAVGSVTPDTIRAVLTVNGVNYSGKWKGWPSDTTKRIAVGFDASTLATGVYGYTLTVTGTYNNGSPALQIYSATNEFVVVNRQGSPFGSGWWLAGLEQLVPASGNRWLWVGSDGSHHVYNPVPGSTTAWATDNYDRPDSLFKVDTLLVRRLPGRTEVHFDLNGRHVETVDARQQHTYFRWSGSLLSRIDLPVAGYSYVFGYGNNGNTRLSSVTSPGQGASRVTQVQTAADATGRVTQITDPDGRFVSFGYSGTDHRIQTRTDRAGWASRFAYGEGSKLTLSNVPAGVGDTISRTFRAAEGQGVTTAAAAVYTYIDGPLTDSADVYSFVEDRYGAVYDVVAPHSLATYIYRTDTIFPGLATRVDYPNGRLTIASYDSHAHLRATSDYGITSPDGRIATTTYDWDPLCEMPTRVVLPEGEVSETSYTSFCSPAWQQAGTDTSRRVRIAYRSLSDATAPGLPSSVTYPKLEYQAAAPTESFDYDARGNVASVTFARGYVTHIYSDAIGRDTLAAPPAGDSTRTRYDAMSRPVRVTRFARTDSVVVIDSLDAEGRPLRNVTQMFPDTNHIGNRYIDWRYDAAGRRIWEKNPSGATDSTVYNPAGQVIAHYSRRRDGLNANLRYVTTMSYDVFGRLTTRIVPSAHYAAETLFIYQSNWYFPKYALDADSGSALPTVIPADTSRFTYDVMGNMLTANNRDAHIARRYDLAGRIVADTLSIRPWTGSDFTRHVYGLQYGYDLEGRRVWMKHPGNMAASLPTPDTMEVYWYEHDRGALRYLRDLTGNYYGYHYNLWGQPDTVYKPNGEILTQRYDAEGNFAASYSSWSGVAWATDTLAYDPIGKVTFGSSPDMPLESEFTAFGALSLSTNDAVGDRNYITADQLGNAYTERRQYHATGGDEMQASDVVEKHFYPQDGSGSTTGFERTQYGQTTRLGSALYQYDASGNRDRWHSLDWYKVATTLDPEARWIEEVGRSYYDASDQLRATDRQRCNVYDTSFTSCVAWNASAGWEPSAFEWYRYDALGRRIYRRIFMKAGPWQNETQCPGNDNLHCRDHDERIVWDGDQVLWEVRSQGTEDDAANGYDVGRVGYTHGGLDAPLSIYRVGYYDGSVHTLITHLNWRGLPDSATFAYGDAGTDFRPSDIQWPARNYDANFRQIDWRASTKWFGSIITGSRDASGVSYRRNRYYDPNSGQFTQTDPVGLAGGINTYGFADGDPISYDDPLGLCPECIEEGMEAFSEAFPEAAEAIGDVAEPVEDALIDGENAVGDAISKATTAVEETTENAATEVRQGSQRAYDSFRAFKRAEGPAGPNQHWHHVVEQNPTNVARFGQRALQNTSNLVRVAEAAHRRISGYYSSIQEFTNGETVRRWISAQAFEAQREFGLAITKLFGGK